eukprot:4012470-Amphidinium_carterae.1
MPAGKHALHPGPHEAEVWSSVQTLSPAPDRKPLSACSFAGMNSPQKDASAFWIKSAPVCL